VGVGVGVGGGGGGADGPQPARAKPTHAITPQRRQVIPVSRHARRTSVQPNRRFFAGRPPLS